MRPKNGSRWVRPGFDEYKRLYNAYTVLFVTNIAYTHSNHPPQVIYQGDNDHLWSLPLSE